MSKRIALLIHNDQYLEPALAQLSLPVADCSSLASLLREPAIGHFNRVELLLNQPAALVRRQVAELFHGKRRDDELLLYFVGHSVVDEAGQPYLAAADTRLDSLAETAISAAYLTGCMDRSFSRRQILLLDCSTYPVDSSRRDNSGASEAKLAAAFEGRGYGRVVLSASSPARPGEVKNESTGGGLKQSFTHYLIQGLQTGVADADQDGQIELIELYEYIRDQGGPAIRWLQLRQGGWGNLDKFIIARNPHQFGSAKSIKWDLIFGAIMAPLAIVVIGGEADLQASIGMAGLFLLLYALLYLALD